MHEVKEGVGRDEKLPELRVYEPDFRVPGRLICIEGSDSVGKATQKRALVDRLKKVGFSNVVEESFPRYGNNYFADLVRRYLSGEFGDPTKISPVMASLPYALDRLLMKPKLIDDLRLGRNRVLDRYTSANQGHQAGKIQDDVKRRLLVNELRMMEHDPGYGNGLPVPHLTLLLTLDVDVSMELARRRGKLDGHEASREHLVQAQRAFKEIADDDPYWKEIDCTNYGARNILPVEVIHDRVWTEVSPILRINE